MILRWHERSNARVRFLGKNDIRVVRQKRKKREASNNSYVLFKNEAEKNSNMVYVVALGTHKPDGCDIIWIDIVQKYNKYLCPVRGNG